MKEVRYFYAPDVEKELCLSADEALHAVKVLRLKEDDEILVVDGKGHCFECSIVSTGRSHCALAINSKTEIPPLTKGGVHLAVAPTKNLDRMEWFVEKATEISLTSLTPLLCRWSERKALKTDRLEKIAVSAMKQSHKALLPLVHELTPFEKFIKEPFPGQKFIAHCYAPEEIGSSEERPYLSDLLEAEGDCLICIGPEGDFSIEEVKAAVDAGFIPISLGESRLRTETAALVAVHLAYHVKRNTSPRN